MRLVVGPWWAFVLRGSIAVLFGLLAILLPSVALLTLVYLFGLYAIADGVISLAAAARARNGAWTHDYPIGLKEATDLGLPVRSDMPEDISTLMSLFPQPIRRQPSVEYLNAPRRSAAAPERS